MTRSFARGESGQALIVAAMGAFVIAAAFALTIDWGYALLQRRIAQNEADKIALGVGRLLATSVESATASSTTFGIDKGDACDLAREIRDRDARPTPQSVEGRSLRLTFEGPGADDTLDCMSPGAAGNEAIDADTSALFVRVELRYRSLVASVLRQPSVTVAASARVALEGAPYMADGSASCDASRAACIDLARSATAITRTWPLVRFYRPNEFLGTSCGPLCDATTTAPVVFATGGNREPGVELLDLSRDSSRHASATPAQIIQQLLTGWDTTGSLSAGTAPRADRSGACGRDWDSAGGESPAAQNASCSLPNWFDYPVGATLGLNTRWRDDSLRAELGTPRPVKPPSLNTLRLACLQRLTFDQSWLATPSCVSGSVGDWVETAQRGFGPDIVARMRALIAREGATVPSSDELVAAGPNADGVTRYGKAVVVWIYLWDCTQGFTGDAEDGLWSTVADCGPIDLPDRVHLFTVVPFTFYEGLVTDLAIEGFWGGGFVDAGRCKPDRGTSRDCPLNPLANSAFLVADD